MRSPLNKQYRITSPFGQRVLNGKIDMHSGIDLVPSDGKHPTDLFATVDGTVIDLRSTVPDSHTGLNVTTMVTGNYVNIRTTSGYTVIYRHLRANSVCVKLNQIVKTSDKLGVMGTTGQSTGVHLHYQINDTKGIAINPIDYLNNDKQLGSSQPATLKVGDRVKINANAATYFTGQTIPAWVKSNVYTIQQLSSDSIRALLKEIYSWVWTKDITKI